MNLLKNAQSILYLDSILYHYRLSPSGRGRQFKRKYLADYEAVRAHVLSVLQQMKASEQVINTFCQWYYEGMAALFRSFAAGCDDPSDYTETIRRMLKEPTCAYAMSRVNPENLSAADRRDYHRLKKGGIQQMYTMNRLANKVRSWVKRLLKRG